MKALFIIIICFFSIEALAQSYSAKELFIKKKDTLWVDNSDAFENYFLVYDNPAAIKSYSSNISIEKLLVSENFKIKSTPSLLEICKKVLSKKKWNLLISNSDKISVNVTIKNDNTLKIVKVAFMVKKDSYLLSLNDLLKIKNAIYKYYSPRVISPNNNYKIFDYLSDSVFL